MADRKPRVGGRKYGAAVDRTPSDNILWVSTEKAKITVMRQPNKEDTVDDVVVGIGQMGRYGGSMINLTTMTEAELLAVKQVFDQAFELALPVARQRDEEANVAYAAGDDSFDRIYRAVPQVVFREGAVNSYRESVSVGPDDLPADIGADSDPAD